jgi:hypothetical protein
VLTLLRDGAARQKGRHSTKTTRLQVFNEVEALLLRRCSGAVINHTVGVSGSAARSRGCN